MEYPHQLTELQGKEAAKILIEECGWRPGEREVREFLTYVMEKSQFPKEFRFYGKLGGGGKFHAATTYASRSPWYVSAYREDYTSDIETMLARGNARLQSLWLAQPANK